MLIEVKHPKQIILFESYAREEQTPDSDLDLMVIEDTVDHQGMEMIILRKAAGRITPGVGIDILVYQTEKQKNQYRERFCTGRYQRKRSYMSAETIVPRTVMEILTSKKEELNSLAQKYGAHNIRIFGSVARGEETEGSDIDLLVEMDEDASLLDLSLLKNDLEDMLGKTIDITTPPALHPMLAESILKEAVPL